MFNRQRFRQSLTGIGIAPSNDAFDALAAAYGSDGRHYHTADHIAACLLHFDEYRGLAIRPSEIEIAIWFHDAVYDTHAGDNEEQSALWASDYLVSERADEAVVRRVSDMIIATKTHAAATSDESLLVDIDLGILGAPRAAFEKYDAAIRQEYGWVPIEIYRANRTSVLQSFLQRDVIYTTNEIRNKLERQARSNLAEKIRELAP